MIKNSPQFIVNTDFYKSVFVFFDRIYIELFGDGIPQRSLPIEESVINKKNDNFVH